MLAARRFALLAYLWQDNVAGVAFVFFFGQLDLVQIGIEHGSLKEERLSGMLYRKFSR